MPSRIKTIQGEVNPILTQFAIGYRNPQLIARQVAPVISTPTESGTVFSFGKEGMMLYNTERALRANAQKMDFYLTKTTYRCVEHALETSLDYKELEAAQRYGADQVLKLEQRAINMVQRALEVELEKAVADILFGASYYATNNKVTLSGTSQWTDKSNADPIKNILDGKAAARDDMGVEPNTVVFGYDAWRSFREHPTVLDRIKYSQRAIVTTDIAATLLDVEKVYVGQGVYAQDDGTFVDLWGDNCALIYTPPAPELADGTTPHTIILEEMGYPQVKTYDMKKTRDYEVTRKYDVVNVDTSFGYLIIDTNA